jgi:hypothetical protein
MMNNVVSQSGGLPLCRCFLVGLAVLWASGAHANGKCREAGADSMPGYSVACGSKSACLPTDLLEIKPQNTTVAPLTAVCLRVSGGTEHPVEFALPAPAAASAPTTVTYSLATTLHTWVHETANPERLRVMTAAPRGQLLVTAVLTDSNNHRFNAPFLIDLRPWWVSGVLPLAFSVASSSPYALDGVVEIQAPDLKNWEAATQINPATLALVLSGVRLPAMAPEVTHSQSGGRLKFQLRRVAGNADNEAAWNRIVERALTGEPMFKVGLADDKGVQLATAAASNGHDGSFDLPSGGRRYGMPLGLLVAGGLVVFFIGRRTQWRWLRDSYGLPAGLVPHKLATFSLGRLQMAWWTAVIVLSWFAIGAATGHWLGINESALVLMGIGVATAATAMAVLPDKVRELKTTLDTAATDDAKLAAVAAIHNESRLWTQGGLADLLSDFENTGTGLHRLQSLLFTVFFGGWFLVYALQHGAMPTLPSTVLALMGISGSTYVGFKMAAR